MNKMTSSKYYLLKAYYEWIVDNNLTPYIYVDTRTGDVSVPNEYVLNNAIVLNVSPDAILDFELTRDDLSFNATFSSISHDIFIPMHAIRSIYAKENGAGTSFVDETLQDNLKYKKDENSKIKLLKTKEDISKKEKTEEKKPNLKIVK